MSEQIDELTGLPLPPASVIRHMVDNDPTWLCVNHDGQAVSCHISEALATAAKRWQHRDPTLLVVNFWGEEQVGP